MAYIMDMASGTFEEQPARRNEPVAEPGRQDVNHPQPALQTVPLEARPADNRHHLPAAALETLLGTLED